MDIKKDIHAFIKEKYDAEVGDDESLFARGYLDSMDLLDLVAYIEERSGVKIDDTEIVPDNFDTVSSINNMVQRLKQAA